ncbi:ABC-type lipoprotein release transport system permease subunit [Lacrimispora xylanisolvens]|uniref:ABC-type lipoprotein release transport system permease subunit n=1 Tax=Lacrimispora xylanisolvens TaxID=384636 RepID=A0A2S6HNA7_9FIRM|nr:ABC transporter permease [Hungatella xylanolytica]PPK78855.1 ABC-type lipoprotein release transport system permease subunit [Hungatella xylanolytica]
MRIIIKYILINGKEHKARTAVMLLSILISSTLLFVSFSLASSYESAQEKMARGMSGSATVSIHAPGESDSLKIEDIPVLPLISAKVGMLKESCFYHENGYYETVDLIAADLSQLDEINKPRLLDGRELKDFSGRKIILPDRFTLKYGIKKGDKITLQIGGNPVCFEVAEIAAYDTVFLRKTRGATALLPLSTLSGLFNRTDGYNEILIKPAKGVSTADLINGLESVLPDGRFQVSEIINETQIKADARQKSMPFFLISFFSLTISVFIIYSSYKVITLDRLPVIGTFRSIGATQKAVTRILLLESLLYGSIGGLFGIPVGMAVLKLILHGMGKSLPQGIEIPVVITPFSIIASFTTAFAISLLSAWIPVCRASRLPIKEVVLGTVEEPSPPRHLIIGSGSILFLISIFVPKLVPENMLNLAGGFSLSGLIAATILIIPLLTNLVSIGLEWVYGLLSHNIGRLAARNMRDNKNITQNITLLFISISAVIAISVVGDFVNTYISDVFKGAELQGFADGQMTPEFVDQVKNIDGVHKVLPLFVYKNELHGNGVLFSRLEATDNLEWYNSMLALHYTKPLMEEQAVSAFAANRSILLSESCLKRTGLTVGDTLTLSNGSAAASYVITGSFKSRATDVEAVIPCSYAAIDFGMKNYGFLAYTATDPDGVMIQIRDLFGNTQNWSRTVKEFNEDAHSTVGAFLKPMHSLTYFILLLAAIGVINNLLINYMQKRRTIAMYHSIGLSIRQNRRMTVIESFSCGMLGAAISIFVSYMEIRTIFIVAGPKITMEPALSARTFLMAGASGILITLSGSVIPIIKSRQMKIIEEIKF